MAAPRPRHPSRRRGYFVRGEVEFERVLAFSDGVFAIAMTLLVVSVSVPRLADGASTSEMLDALDQVGPDVASFVVSFVVIGRYWLAHHAMFALLRALDRRLVALNLAYLMLIAFLPFPTALIGEYFENPVSVVAYALVAGTVSAMEVVLLMYALRHDLLEERMPRDVMRWGMAMSLTPVAMFALSIPVAFVSTPLAVLVWFGGVPVFFATRRWRPPAAQDWFG